MASLLSQDRALSPRHPRQHLPRYGLALACSLLFTALRLGLEPVLQGQAPLIALLGAPLIASWWGGLGPGVLATVLCAALGELLFIPPHFNLWPADRGQAVSLLIFVAYGLVFSLLNESRLRSLRLAEVRHENLLRAQQELALREQRMRETLEASPAGMLVVNREGHVELVNGQAERLFRLPREALVGRHIDTLVPEAVRARRGDGSEFPVEIGLTPLQGSSSGLVLASVIDISERQRTERALLDSAERLRALADNIPQLAWMADAQGAVHWYNQRWFDYTGTRMADMVGWGWTAVHHPDHAQRVIEKFRRHLQSGEPWEDTFPLRGADGHYRWFLSRAFPIRDESGAIRRWFGTNTDITEQRAAQEALRESDRRKDEFIALLAHELRNPLAPVRSAVEILRRIDPRDPRFARTREVIARQVEHMARLIDDLLDVSRIGRGKLALRITRCDLAAIARDTTEDYRPSLEATGRRLMAHIPAGPLWIDGDAVRLAQMLGNLLNNAGRFSDPGDLITVEVSADAPHQALLLRVTDTGMGIDDGLLSRLFDPFEQGAQDLSRSRGGLGLGLALTRGLAELHGGRIEAASAGPGQGASFTVHLPASPPASSTPPQPHAPSEAGAAASASVPAPQRPVKDDAGLRILLVEDHRDAAETLSELLELAGHRVTVCHDAECGLALARQQRPDVVISDLGLPGELDGYQLARQLRADPQLAGLRLIALSGYADARAQQRSRAAGFDAHLPKPPDIDDLQRWLSQLTGRAEAVPRGTLA
jgi:PAS domain S-box-containing protein